MTRKAEDGDIVRLGSTDFEVKALVQRSTADLVEPFGATVYQTH